MSSVSLLHVISRIVKKVRFIGIDSRRKILDFLVLIYCNLYSKYLLLHGP